MDQPPASEGPEEIVPAAEGTAHTHITAMAIAPISVVVRSEGMEGTKVRDLLSVHSLYRMYVEQTQDTLSEWAINIVQRLRDGEYEVREGHADDDVDAHGLVGYYHTLSPVDLSQIFMTHFYATTDSLNRSRRSAPANDGVSESSSTPPPRTRGRANSIDPLVSMQKLLYKLLVKSYGKTMLRYQQQLQEVIRTCEDATLVIALANDCYSLVDTVEELLQQMHTMMVRVAGPTAGEDEDEDEDEDDPNWAKAERGFALLSTVAVRRLVDIQFAGLAEEEQALYRAIKVKKVSKKEREKAAKKKAKETREEEEGEGGEERVAEGAEVKEGVEGAEGQDPVWMEQHRQAAAVISRTVAELLQSTAAEDDGTAGAIINPYSQRKLLTSLINCLCMSHLRPLLRLPTGADSSKRSATDGTGQCDRLALLLLEDHSRYLAALLQIVPSSSTSSASSISSSIESALQPLADVHVMLTVPHDTVKASWFDEFATKLAQRGARAGANATVAPGETVALFRCVLHVLGIRDDVSEARQTSIASDIITNAKCLAHLHDGKGSSNGSSRRIGDNEPSVFVQLATAMPETATMLPAMQATAMEGTDSESLDAGSTGASTPTPKKGKARGWLSEKVASIQHGKSKPSR
jgi:hypothetical protein